MSNHELQRGINMRRALLAHAASAGGDLVPREAEFFEAGYAAGTVVTEQVPVGIYIPPALQDEAVMDSFILRSEVGKHIAQAVARIFDLQPLIEPVSIHKALLAHREARVSLSGGTGPVACVMLVNIQLTAWTHTEATATAFADGYNQALWQLRGTLRDVAASASATLIPARPGHDQHPEQAASPLGKGGPGGHLAPPPAGKPARGPASTTAPAPAGAVDRTALLTAMNSITRMLMGERTSALDEDDDGEFAAGKAAGIVQYHAELLKHIQCAPAPAAPASCWCTRCLDAGPGVVILGMRVPASTTRMILCPTCGNKRCPHANDHDNACSGSNDPGQPGSAWASWPAPSKPE